MVAPGLSVLIDDGSTRRAITGYVSGLRFTKVAPGGHQSLQCQVALPYETFPRLGPNDQIVVSDQRNARPVFDGYTKNPTPVDGLLGQSFDLTAVGGMWRGSDEARPLVYVTRDLSVFEKATDSEKSTTYTNGPQIGGEDVVGIQVQFPSGMVAATDSFASAGNYLFARGGMVLGGVKATLLAGLTSTDWAQEFVITTGTPATSQATASPAPFEQYAGDDWVGDVDRFAFRLRRTGGSTNVASDDIWLLATDFSAVGQRMDRRGGVVNGAAGLGSADSVLASQVVEDLLGRLLTMCDPATAVVDATAWPIDQLAYIDGTKAAQVLTDLQAWEPDYLWEILERLPNGLHRFGWRAWPTTPRYVVSTADGWVQQGSDQDVCNRVLVTWTDHAGSAQSLAVTAADLLTDGLANAADLDGVGDGLTAGQIRDADRVSLPDGTGSAANAARVGRGVLLDTIKPPRAGTITVRRPILDLLTGNTVMPWELEPGYLCRVREKGWDLRVTQVDYDHTAQAAVLTLGTPVLSDEQRVARLDAA